MAKYCNEILVKLNSFSVAREINHENQQIGSRNIQITVL